MMQVLHLPYSKSQTSDDPKLEVRPGELILTYDYIYKRIQPVVISIIFSRVLAFCFIDETCPIWSIEVINSGITERDLVTSAWLQQLKEGRKIFFSEQASIYEMSDEFPYRHFSIWFDHHGTYEIVAESYTLNVQD